MGKKQKKWEAIDEDDFASKDTFFTGKEPESVGAIMSIYEDQYSTKYRHSEEDTWRFEQGRGCNFLNQGCNNFISLLEEGIYNKTGQKIRTACIWNDVSKLASPEGHQAGKSVHEIERECLGDVVKKEIEILKPDIVLCLCGSTPTYETYMMEALGCEKPLPFGHFDYKDAAKLVIPNVKLGYRTWHPRTSISKPNCVYYRAIEAFVADIIKQLPLVS